MSCDWWTIYHICGYIWHTHPAACGDVAMATHLAVNSMHYYCCMWMNNSIIVSVCVCVCGMLWQTVVCVGDFISGFSSRVGYIAN